MSTGRSSPFNIASTKKSSVKILNFNIKNSLSRQRIAIHPQKLFFFRSVWKLTFNFKMCLIFCGVFPSTISSSLLDLYCWGKYKTVCFQWFNCFISINKYQLFLLNIEAFQFRHILTKTQKHFDKGETFSLVYLENVVTLQTQFVNLQTHFEPKLHIFWHSWSAFVQTLWPFENIFKTHKCIWQKFTHLKTHIWQITDTFNQNADTFWLKFRHILTKIDTLYGMELME